MLGVLDAFWRSALYCLRLRVIALSLVPFSVMAIMTGLMAYFFWGPAVDAVRIWLGGSAVLESIWTWLSSLGLAQAKVVMAPLLVVLLATPVVVTLSLILVAVFMVPRIVNMVANSRFPGMERQQGGNWWLSLAWGIGSLLMAIGAIVVTMPLWLIPPLLLLLPPLIWGWLTARVMSYDALTDHASSVERRIILRRHRIPLLVMGVVVGYLSALPSMMWTLGITTVFIAPFLIPIAIWLYTAVFVFSTLWFVHFSLAALHQLRLQIPPNTQLPVMDDVVGGSA